MRATPDQFIDEPVALQQFFCPSCLTAVHTGIAPEKAFTSINGFVLAN